jgi:flagellar hook protein FlgE
MASSLLTGVSGLQANQTLLDVTGNNLANENTVGFKTQSVQFEDLIYQNLANASLVSTSTVGGTNPVQVGTGVKVASINTDFGEGSLSVTGRNYDLALQGNGFFVVNDGTQNQYTRAGSFDVDTNGFLVDPSTGFRVQRFGTVGETGPTPFQVPGNDDIKIPIGTGIPATPTTTVNVQGNLSSTLAVGGTYSTAIQVFDTQGTAHSLTLTFTKSAANTFSLNATVSGGTVAGVPFAGITFNADGSLAGPASVPLSLSFPPGLPAAQPVSIALGTVGQVNGLTQFGGSSTAAAVSQDGASAGSLTSVSVAEDGTIRGIFSNGQSLPLAQIAVAQFANPGGLNRDGNNLYSQTANSGQPLIGTALSGGRGSIQQGALEQSNVNVALEFTNLIVAERSFQANAQTITVSDNVLQTLVNIIR